jgi:hypothetical protein
MGFFKRAKRGAFFVLPVVIILSLLAGNLAIETEKGIAPPEEQRQAFNKPGVCPPASGLASTCDFKPGVNCVKDSECAGVKKCCPEGCGRVCKCPRGGCPRSKSMSWAMLKRPGD